MRTKIFKNGDKVRLVPFATAIARGEQNKSVYKYDPCFDSIFGIARDLYEKDRAIGIMIVKSKTGGGHINLQESIFAYPTIFLEKI